MASSPTKIQPLPLPTPSNFKLGDNATSDNNNPIINQSNNDPVIPLPPPLPTGGLNNWKKPTDDAISSGNKHVIRKQSDNPTPTPKENINPTRVAVTEIPQTCKKTEQGNFVQQSKVTANPTQHKC